MSSAPEIEITLYEDDEDGPDTVPSGLQDIPDIAPPPRVPSNLPPYFTHVASWHEAGLVALVAGGSLSTLYLGFEFEHHWQIGGYPGLVWFGSVVVAAGLVGATVFLLAVLRGK